MGCGESKHAVSTENVLTKIKSKAKSAENNPPVVESANSDGNVNDPNEVKENEIPDVIKKEEIEKGGEGTGIFHEKDGKEKGVDDHGNGDFGGKVEEKKEEEGKVEDAAVEVVEEKKEELKGGKNENTLAKKDEEEQEKLISDDSPKETIETIVSDGVSGLSENDSPGKSNGKDAVEGKGKDEEANLDAEKEEVLKIDEGNNVVQVDETKVSVTKEEKTPAEDESAKATSTNDVKEN